MTVSPLPAWFYGIEGNLLEKVWDDASEILDQVKDKMDIRVKYDYGSIVTEFNWGRWNSLYATINEQLEEESI